MILPWMENGGILRYISKLQTGGELSAEQLEPAVHRWVRVQSMSLWLFLTHLLVA